MQLLSTSFTLTVKLLFWPPGTCAPLLGSLLPGARGAPAPTVVSPGHEPRVQRHFKEPSVLRDPPISSLQTTRSRLALFRSINAIIVVISEGRRAGKLLAN